MQIRTFLAAAAPFALPALLAVPASAAPVALSNATATFSQGFGGGIDATIDGNTLGDANGWAIFDGSANPTVAQTAAYDVAGAAVPASNYTFTLFNEDNSNVQHTVGKFRISVTADDPSTFADGADTGGDVTANWVEVTPTLATATNGTTLTIGGDNTVEASGDNPAVSTYTVTATSPLLNVTGFRLEVFEDADLPDTGPGRSFNGNFVLTEFTADAVPEPAALGLLSLAGLLMGRRRR